MLLQISFNGESLVDDDISNVDMSDVLAGIANLADNYVLEKATIYLHGAEKVKPDSEGDALRTIFVKEA